jgi:hypothetical protein
MNNSLILTAEERARWISLYNETKKLPNTCIPCSKCNTAVTATHGNLETKIKKYNGISNLLHTFICKKCSLLSLSKKPKTIKTAAKKIVKKADKNDEADFLKKDAEGRYNIPLVNFNNVNKSYSIKDISQSKELTIEFTKGTCWRPKLYLDNDSYCTGCELYEHCACSAKRMPASRKKDK